ncbi:metal-sulfur cluster assembly factor [Ciceribacter ferrooxidans]|uniref:Metal-sulfur cluster assembly factor n=1 Tax=Ciceribacter ferrooxidans TaxID=2509717 RepID=A0A4Q2TAB1_9HYPH|nr:metal-sulfur cluster assembly factor [Ciceribacter ferrooxidans]RYC15304.1 metal-sulfur cluster assembly factor [Ciceribacter ferrooxidans]
MNSDQIDSDRLAFVIDERLRTVIDPELGENIVDLGLIYGIVVSPAGAVRVTMTTTTKGCPATSFLTEAVEACVRGVEGVSCVEIDLTYEPPWSPDLMASAAAMRF